MKIRKYHTQPAASIISRGIDGGVDYTDSFEVKIPNSKDISIDYLTALLFSSVPRWVLTLLKIRDVLVKPLGLQTGGIPEYNAIDPSIQYKCGDKAIFFCVIDRSENEIVMGEDDRHLYFRTSVCIQGNPESSYQSLFLTTIVQFHNALGRLYFEPVKPFHRLIMKKLLIRFHKTLKQQKRKE